MSKNKDEEKVEIKEEIKNEVIDYPNKKSKKGYVITIFIVLFVSLIGVFIWLLCTDRIDFKNKSNKEVIEETKKIELKHTEAATVKSDGVYITDVSEVVDKVMPSIVAITSKTVITSGMYGPLYYGGYTATGAGSGVIVAEDENEIYILTNYHVVENSTELSVKFIDDNSYDAKIKGTSERKDIAIVSVLKEDISADTLKKIKIATLGNSNDLKVGNGIIAIGNALGYGQSVTTGVVSALNREVETDEYILDMIQIDAAINGGNSGGALLNSKGEVVGINSVKYSQKSTSSSASIEGMGFAIPISDVENIIEKLINGEEDDSEVYLGIEGYMTNSGNMIYYRLPEGFYVAAITDGSNASKSELEIGNIITEIDGVEVASVDTFKKVLGKKEKGDTITLKIKYASRNEYKEKEIKVNLE